MAAISCLPTVQHQGSHTFSLAHEMQSLLLQQLGGGGARPCVG
jgi:hypothetical protein